MIYWAECWQHILIDMPCVKYNHFGIWRGKEDYVECKKRKVP